MNERNIKGNICDFDFYVVNFNGGKAKLPEDTPDKYGMTLHEAISEFKRQAAINPPNYITAIGVDFSVHADHRELNAGHTEGSIDYAHFENGEVKMLDDMKQDKVIQAEGLLKYNAYEAIRRETSSMTIKPQIPLYDKPREYARENGEIDQYRESIHENRRCAKYIENLVADYHADNLLHSATIVDEAVKAYGEKRVEMLLANTIQEKPWDGRFSHSNKEWAASVYVPKDDNSRDICINAHPALLDGVVTAYRKHLEILEKTLAEQQQEKNNAPEKRAESEDKMAHETTFAVSNMSKLDGEGAKALATVVLNGEISLSGIKVGTDKNGELKVTTPAQMKYDGNFENVYFPITPEAQAALKKAVLDVYSDMTAKGQDKYKADIPLSEKSFSTITAQMSKVDKGSVKAAGEVVIDKCFVIKGVTQMNGTNQQGENKNFVSMPSRQTATGEYYPYVKPITAAAREKINNAVQGSINNIDRYKYAGVKFAELGDKDSVKQSGRLNNKFAAALMNKLDEAGIQYHAKIAETTTLSFNEKDKPAFDSVKKALVSELNPQKQSAPQQEQKQQHKKSK